MTAPSPARLIARGKLGISVWVRVILDKYLYSRPSHRLLQELAGQGVRLSPGTIAGGLRKLLPLLEPVREAIRSKQLSEDRWQADETGWRVFEEVEGKEGHGWHLWVFRSPSTVVFTLSPSRSAQVPEAHFGDHAAGILLAGPLRRVQEVGQTMGGSRVGLLLGPRATRLFLLGQGLARTGGLGD